MLKYKEVDSIDRLFTGFTVIGKGKYGVVFSAQSLTQEGELVAIKVITKETYSLKEALFRNEIEVLRKLKNQRGIVQLKEYFIDKEETHFLLFDLANMGNLDEYIRNYGVLPEAQARIGFGQLVRALMMVHERGYVHRDIKPENILLSCKGNRLELILSDFGMAKKIEKGILLDEYCGSPLFIAPEVASGSPHDPFKAEIWTLGVTLYIMIFGRYPFHSTVVGTLQEMAADLYQQILTTNPSFEGVPISSTLLHLLYYIFRKNPSKRISLGGIFGHPWLGFVIKKRPVGNNTNLIKSRSSLNLIDGAMVAASSPPDAMTVPAASAAVITSAVASSFPSTSSTSTFPCPLSCTLSSSSPSL